MKILGFVICIIALSTLYGTGFNYRTPDPRSESWLYCEIASNNKVVEFVSWEVPVETVVRSLAVATGHEVSISAEIEKTVAFNFKNLYFEQIIPFVIEYYEMDYFEDENGVYVFEELEND